MIVGALLNSVKMTEFIESDSDMEWEHESYCTRHYPHSVEMSRTVMLVGIHSNLKLKCWLRVMSIVSRRYL